MISQLQSIVPLVLSNDVLSPPTLFSLYIDELEDFLLKSLLPRDGCYLHQVLISILLFADDVILLASSSESL